MNPYCQGPRRGHDPARPREKTAIVTRRGKRRPRGLCECLPGPERHLSGSAPGCLGHYSSPRGLGRRLPAQGHFRCTPHRYRAVIRWKGTRYGVAALCATADSGRTWTPVLYEGSRFRSYVRLSPRIGAVIVSGFLVQHDPPHTDPWWDAIFTLDGGKHWFGQYLDVLVPERQRDPDPWGCWKPGCPPPSFRIARESGRRALLTDAPDGHTYVVEGLWKTAATSGCQPSARQPYALIKAQKFCPIPPRGGLWLRRLN